jgi:hypothetical protein
MRGGVEDDLLGLDLLVVIEQVEASRRERDGRSTAT